VPWNQAEHLLRAQMDESLQLCELDPDENLAELANLPLRMLRGWWDQVDSQVFLLAQQLRW
jgi:hypothetical protein